MNNIEISKELLTFIDSSKSMFHTVDTMKKYFDKALSLIHISEPTRP